MQKMAAEIKIISPSFYSKNIDGNSNIDQYTIGKKIITNPVI